MRGFSLALLAAAALVSVADAIASVPHTHTPSAPKGPSASSTLRAALSPARQLRAPSPSLQSSGGLRGGASVGGLWARYEELLDQEPLKTRIWSGFVIGVLGDVICQYATRSTDEFVLDVKRCLVFAVWGAIGFTPLAFKWYGGMESALSQDIKVRGMFPARASLPCLPVPPAPLAWRLDPPGRRPPKRA